MRLEIDMPEHHYNNIMAVDSMSLGRAPYKGIIMYAINAIKRGKVLEQEPTTKNDLGVDCIDRAELLKATDTWDKFGYTAQYGLERLDKDDKGFVPYVKYDDMVNCVKGMPSVTPQEPRCKDCKWWKDSDGKYRRGCGAESPCPINTHTVCCGEGYCYMFEPQESEET